MAVPAPRGAGTRSRAVRVERLTQLRRYDREIQLTFKRLIAIGQLLRAIDAYEGSLIVQCALRLAPSTFVRPIELRSAR